MAEKKSPGASAIETRYILAPHQVNSFGTAFGGVIMSWIDMVAAMAAQRHCQGVVVTASIDKISFKAPIHVGDHVVLKASVNYVGKTSMEVGVRVHKEDPVSGEQVRTTTAYLTFVRLDRDGLPREVPPLEPKTPDEKRRYGNAKHRVDARRDLLSKLKRG
ncbi:MAG: acyl-CoA thioesterase [Candidatus Krumholzibacteriia bacterium]